jgi:bacillolysin
MKAIGISILFVFFAVITYSQKKPSENLPLIKSEADGNMYYLAKEESAEITLKNVKSFFKLTPEDELVLYKTNADEVGNSHLKYQHYHNGIPVYGSQIILHSKNNLVYAVNGDLFPITSGEQPGIGFQDAQNHALASVGKDAHLFSATPSDEEERFLPLLEYYKVKDLFVLTYKITVESTKPHNKYTVRISATDGSVVSKQSLFIDCLGNREEGHDHRTTVLTQKPVKPEISDTKAACNGDCNNGTGTMLYYTNQYLVIGKHQFGLDCKYRLLNGCYSTVIHTMSRSNISNNSQNGNGQYEYTDQTTYFNFAVLAPGNTAHWGITMADEFYRGYFGRNGFSGGGGTLNAFCNENSIGTDNAYYDPSTDELNFGSGGGSLAHNDIVSLDIVGHEFTHGVSQYEANFDTYGEPGALNESFSDIMGTMIEDYAKYIHGTGTSFSYDYGNEPYYHTTYTIPGGPTIYTNRDMSYPNNSNLPDTYNGTHFWNPASTSVDYGGRHINCTIQDYWFYLLAEGGSGTNDLGNPFCVQGIGKNSAMRIVYQNLCNYMGTYSNFAAARSGSIQSAIDLFGANSNEVAQVTAAWYAVGVGSQYSGQINIYNTTINSNYSQSYNAGISIKNVTVNNPVQMTVTSNNYIELLPDVVFNQGVVADLHIAPACAGGARPANSGDVSSFETAQEKSMLTSEEENEGAFRIYPNPTDGIVTVEHPEGTKEVLVYNVVGKLILQTEVAGGTLTRINLNGQPSGTYLMKVDGSQVKRLIKQ